MPVVEHTSEPRARDAAAVADALRTAAETLRRAGTVAVVCHENPDADTIGGGLALADALGRVGVAAEVVCDGARPSTLGFLPGVDRIREAPTARPDVLVFVDCATARRAGARLADVLGAHDGPTVVVDHHRSNPGYGTINCLDHEAAASSVIVARLIRELGTPFTHDIAVQLLAGILHDTDGLRTPETSAETLRLVADLVDAGASLGAVHAALFGRRPAAALRLWGHVARDLEVANDGRVVVGVLRRQMLDATGAQLLDAEDLPELLAGIDGASVALLLREVDEGTRVSIRTAGAPSAAEIATRLGGGGHDRAAGCVLPMPVDDARDRLLLILAEMDA